MHRRTGTHGIWDRDAQAEEEEDNRMTASLAGLAFALFLVIAGLFLVQQLRNKARVEDCLLSGRNNCDQLVAHVVPPPL